MTPHSLSPADIIDLRSSLSYRAAQDWVQATSTPLIIYLPADDAFLLYAYGRAQARHADPAVLAQCLRCERAEPGFIRRILDPAQNCEVATLSPDLRAADARRSAEERERNRLRAQEAEDARLRRANALDVKKLSLDDLL